MELNKKNGAHILDLKTIGFVTSGLGQLRINDNWPQERPESQTIENLNQNKCSTLRVEHGRNGSARAA